MKYIIHYSYRNKRGEQVSGEWHTNNLTEVYAFGGMIDRYGGRMTCKI